MNPSLFLVILVILIKDHECLTTRHCSTPDDYQELPFVDRALQAPVVVYGEFVNVDFIYWRPGVPAHWLVTFLPRCVFQEPAPYTIPSLVSAPLLSIVEFPNGPQCVDSISLVEVRRRAVVLLKKDEHNPDWWQFSPENLQPAVSTDYETVKEDLSDEDVSCRQDE